MSGKKRNDIRVNDVPDKTFKEVKRRAKVEKRTIGRQLLYEAEKSLLAKK